VWARGVLETRAFALPADVASGNAQVGVVRAGELVLAPLCDMVNHSQAPQLQLRVGVDGSLQLHTMVDVPPNTQLCYSYGSHDKVDLLIHHGIFSPSAVAVVGGGGGGGAGGGAGGGSSLVAGSTAPPLHLSVNLQPCNALAEHDTLLSKVILILSHLGLTMDGWLTAGVSGGGGGGCSGGGGGVDGGVQCVPAALVAAARLLSVRTDAEFNSLSLGRALGTLPLSSTICAPSNPCPWYVVRIFNNLCP
jgi:hypothetical protein